MKRIQHPWHLWEDFRHNFYGGLEDAPNKEQSLETYAGLLKDLGRFEAALQRIVSEWPYACEHNLTNKNMNRIAYMGQAACALEYRIPHYISCSGYNLLTPEEQAAADAMAQKYIDIWEARHKERMNVAS